MKKSLTATLVLIMTLSLAACGGADAPADQTPSPTLASSTESAVSQAPASESTSGTSAESKADALASDDIKPVGEFENSTGELLTITESNISCMYNGKNYSADYSAASAETMDGEVVAYSDMVRS